MTAPIIAVDASRRVMQSDSPSTALATPPAAAQARSSAILFPRHTAGFCRFHATPFDEAVAEQL